MHYKCSCKIFLLCLCLFIGNKEHLSMKWIQLIDSGGQPQFHHLLPFFAGNLSAVLFVLKLSERFDQPREIACYGSDGKMIGGTYETCYSHKEVMECSLKAFQTSPAGTDGPCEPNGPLVIVIGTHEDCEDTCDETRKDKNKRVNECLQINKRCAPLYVGQDMTEVIFGVNCKAPDKKDRKVAKVLRKNISKLTPKSKKMPIAWFGLEVTLHDLTQKKRREALTVLECKQAAERVQLKDEAFTAALNHLAECNILLYYPDVLPDVVFCNPQVLLSIITELVQHRYKLLEHPDTTKPTPGDWKRFKDYAYITQKLLDEFPGHYYDGVFSSSDLIRLFISHSIMAPVSKEEYLMPALLPELCPRGCQSIILSGDPLPSGDLLGPLLSGDPLLIRYKGGCFPNGVFCFLVSFLINDAKWTVYTKEGKPKCLYSNSVAFSTSQFPATVTIIDNLLYLAVHIVLSHGFPSPHLSVLADVHRGIMSACKHLGYQYAEEDIIVAKCCRYDDCGGEARHHADIRVTENGSWAICSKDEARKMSCPTAVSASCITVLGKHLGIIQNY